MVTEISCGGIKIKAASNKVTVKKTGKCTVCNKSATISKTIVVYSDIFNRKTDEEMGDMLQRKVDDWYEKPCVHKKCIVAHVQTTLDGREDINYNKLDNMKYEIIFHDSAYSFTLRIKDDGLVSIGWSYHYKQKDDICSYGTIEEFLVEYDKYVKFHSIPSKHLYKYINKHGKLYHARVSYKSTSIDEFITAEYIGIGKTKVEAFDNALMSSNIIDIGFIKPKADEIRNNMIDNDEG